tara:strand:- start:3556 stop:4296 length:741 start_codon:yes stop_codon:yes gene_type:complete
MKIAIPSYKRADTVVEKTLSYLLNDCKVSQDCITVFVANQDEYAEYKEKLPEGIKIVVGKETLRGQRNFMDFYYEVEDKVLFFDDDVEGLYKKNGSNSALFTDLKALYKIGFNECLKHKTALFGICAVNNGFYMSNKISTNLKYIVGCFYGQIITRDKHLSVTLEDKEDFERTVLYFHKYKKVVRLNMLAPKTNYYDEEGGMQVTRTEDRVTVSALNLIKRYPQYCSLNTKKKSKHTELKLNSRAV